MTFRIAALVVLAAFALPLSAHAGAYNSKVGHNMHVGSFDGDNGDTDESSITAVTSNSTSEVLVSNTGAWEAIQARANAVRNGTAAQQLISNNVNTNNVVNTTSTTNNNNGYRYVNGTYTNNYGGNNNYNGNYNNSNRSNYNGNSDIYLRSQNNNRSSGTYANQSRYNFQYGGYAIQNNINDIREDGRGSRRQVVRGYQNTGLSGYNFYGDPANYEGADYQNYRGYDNFVEGFQAYPGSRGYNRH
jgi:hypothetical protein